MFESISNFWRVFWESIKNAYTETYKKQEKTNVQDFEDIVKVNITKLLTEELLVDKTQEEKEHETWDYIKNYLDSLDFKILILHGVDYMFSPELGNLDVISNFKYYSRNGHVIVLFINARLMDNHLIYSEEGYPDYRSMDVSEVNIVGWE